MIYTFRCDCGAETKIEASISVGPPGDVVPCCLCQKPANRDWKADAPMIDTSACKDHSSVKESARVRSHFDRSKSPERIENEFRQHVQRRRQEIRDAGGQRGSMRQTHAVPAHLYHGKIRETGDKNYWSDPKNLARHTECKVDG